MKKILAILFAAAGMSAAVSSNAQPAFRAPLADSPEAPAYLLPQTTIRVYVTVEKETVHPGPYARYAQKYLGVMAPLAEKEIYTITGASLDYSDPGRTFEPIPVTIATGSETTSHVDGGDNFALFSPVRTSMAEKGAEDMARDAVQTIYTLRQRRFDLVTGEAGENVFGGGMGAALDEMRRLEEEYLALFLGKRTVATETRSFDIVPDGRQNTYVVCRFTPQGGILSQSDLGGEPVTLMLNPEKGVSTPAGKSSRNSTELYRLADYTGCRVAFGQKELSSSRFPVLQYGITVTGSAK